MTKDQLIAKQQLQIETLSQRLEWANDDKRKIAKRMICVGGPMNGNTLKFNSEQLALLYQILLDAEAGDHEEI